MSPTQDEARLDVDKLIERLRKYGSGHMIGVPLEICDEAAAALATLRDALAEAEQERDSLRKSFIEVEREKWQTGRERDALRERAERLERALRELIEDVTPSGAEASANERFEELAARFYADTGMLAPGKADRSGTHTYEERQSRFFAWIAAPSGAEEEK